MIVIFSKDLASHLKRLEAMFQKLEKAGLKPKFSKCALFYRQIAYLGYIVFVQGIVTNEGKINVIRKWPTPTTVTEVQSFLGFTGYYCRFILKGLWAPLRPNFNWSCRMHTEKLLWEGAMMRLATYTSKECLTWCVTVSFGLKWLCR